MQILFRQWNSVTESLPFFFLFFFFGLGRLPGTQRCYYTARLLDMFACGAEEQLAKRQRRCIHACIKESPMKHLIKSIITLPTQSPSHCFCEPT
jgi:hypothetical protein